MPIRIRKIPGPKSSRIVSSTKKHCVKTTFAYPLAIKSGRGCYIEDYDGNVFLDFNSNVCSTPLGYSHPAVTDVLKEFSLKGAHKIAGQDFYSEEQEKLAAKLLKISPRGLSKVFLVNSGAEAVENAIKLAYRKMGPKCGVSFVGDFHGRTLGALTYTHSKWVHKKNFPEFDHCLFEFCEKSDDPHADDILKIAMHRGSYAFILTELVQGEGGYNFASRRFAQNIRKAATAAGVPLIIDEVQTGLGRTGMWFSFEHYGIKPDIMALAKALQVGAAITSKRYAPEEEGAVSSTWGGGHRIDMAVGLRTIEVIEKQRLLLNVKKMGFYLLKGLIELAEKHDNKVVDVRGLGLMLRMRLKSKKAMLAVETEAFKRGLVIVGCGEDRIRITPPFILKKDEADEGLHVLDKVLAKLKP